MTAVTLRFVPFAPSDPRGLHSRFQAANVPPRGRNTQKQLTPRTERSLLSKGFPPPPPPLWSSGISDARVKMSAALLGNSLPRGCIL